MPERSPAGWAGSARPTPAASPAPTAAAAAAAAVTTATGDRPPGPTDPLGGERMLDVMASAGSPTGPRPAPPTLSPRPVASSIEELLGGPRPRRPFRNSDAKSGSTFERVEVEGEPYVLKVLHVDDDWIARSIGDVTCLQARVWAAGVLDALPAGIDHAIVGVATGLGRNGWGAAVLMRDVGRWLTPPGDARVPLAQHAAFVDHMAGLSARFWGWSDTIGLLPPSLRYSFFGPGMLAVEAAGGWRNEVPRISATGWGRFADRAPADVCSLVDDLRNEPWALADALAATPATFVHGDWKMGNLGSHPDGRTILLDCAYPGEGPACHDLTWYLALNRARLPEPKEATIARYRRRLGAHGVDTTGWWDRQLGLCLLGGLVQFGWEKALGDDAELAWWVDQARAGARWL
jgi:hypothetical protein